MMQYVCNVILSPHIAILEDSCEMTKNTKKGQNDNIN